MPWQAVPALLVITGAFTATGVLMRLVDEVAYGKHRRVMIDEFSFKMDGRDKAIKAQSDAAAKAAAAGLKESRKLS